MAVASGFDLSGQNTYRLMKARLGVYEKKPFQEQTIDGVNQQARRLRAAGGNRQQERMIEDKWHSFRRALHYSYQSAEVHRIDAEDPQPVRALINSNKLKQDYDDKIISVDYEENFQPGDVFEWLGTHTHWLVYLQDLTELSYFRGDIRKCNYKIDWEDEDGELQSTWIAVRGPVETKINFIQKNGISLDTPNHSLNILMPKNDATIKRFQRYSKFYLQNADNITEQVCWRVEATDTISMPGVLEITAVEYYSNETEDDVEKGLVGGLVIKPEDPTPKTLINGETFIRPKKVYTFIYTGTEEGKWYLDSNKYPIQHRIKDKTIELVWTKTLSGQFILGYGSSKKTIVVESLF